MALPLAPLIILGIASLTTFIVNEMTEEERRSQEKLKEKFNEREKEKEQWKQERQQLHEQRIALSEIEYEKRLEKLKEEEARIFHHSRKEVIDSVIREATLQVERVEKWQTEVEHVIKIVVKEKKTSVQTSLRKSALEQLEREMHKQKSQLISLHRYLNSYINIANRKWRNDIESEVEPFLYRLPPDFPYFGKVIHIPVEDIRKRMPRIVASFIHVNYIITDEDVVREKIEKGENHTLPFLIESFDSKERAYRLHFGKGQFMQYAEELPYFGMEAIVVEKNRRSVILERDGFQMELPMRQLERLNKVPFVGAVLQVFPYRWQTTLRQRPLVTERVEEALTSAYFDSVPFLIPEDQLESFFKILEMHDIAYEKSEWKIGPDRQSNRSDSYIFQFGLHLVMRVALEERLIGQTKHTVFILREILSPEQSFQPDDIFASIQATMEVQIDTPNIQQSQGMLDTMFRLSIYLMEEFERQRHIRASREGMLYFQKWSDTLQLLIRYIMMSGERIPVRLRVDEMTVFTESIPPLRKWKIPVDNVEDVKKIVLEHEGSLHCFIPFGPHLFYNAYFNSDCDHLFIITPDDEKLDGPPSELDVIIQEYAMAEVRQQRALRQFLTGELVSDTLQVALMQPSAIQSKRVLPRPKDWVNTYIAKNEAQRQAVEEAMIEQDFYAIQGPPGTGKTTVIREIIHQQLRLHPYSRILIVSQANVAIDNVLKDLPQQLLPDSIRCGRDDKMEDSVQQISFNRAFDSYVDTIRTHTVPTEQKPLFEEWRSFVERAANERSRFVGELGELLIRSHSIIGATCVGLASESLGIDDLPFDLVIIDEAGKALPGELLIPINRAKKLILIGDHKQLPPVIHPALYDEEKIELMDGEVTRNLLFEQSLFERVYVDCPQENRHMLSTQYRMPPVIGTMVSKLFYDGKLENGQSTYEKRPIAFAHPLNLLNVEDDRRYVEQTTEGVSNKREAEVVRDIVNELLDRVDPAVRIAVITPYRKQSRLLRNAFGKINTDRLAINTVDAFQGDEAEIVIYAMTRTRRKTLYFSDAARLNVAFSRAKNELLIIGSRKYLRSYGSDHIVGKVGAYLDQHAKQSPDWKELLKPTN